MKSILALLLALCITACQPPSKGAPQTPPETVKSANVADRIVLDTSTPDRALKSYWTAKDSLRRAEYDLAQQHIQKNTELRTKIGFDPAGIVAGDALAAARSAASAAPQPFDQYSRDIVDIKQDTESRATAIVKINNSTPIPGGKAISEADRRMREAGEKYKYILEKDSGGWKVSQAYQHDEYHAKYGDGKGDPWKSIFRKSDWDLEIRSVVFEHEN